MINISHAKVITKPPISKYYLVKKKNDVSKYEQNAKDVNVAKVKFNNDQRECNNECLDCSAHESLLDSLSCDLGIDTIFRNAEINMKYNNNHQSTSDCNQNVINCNSSTIEELYNTINEQNLSYDVKIGSGESIINPVEYHSIACDIKDNIDQILPERDISTVPSAIVNSTYDDIMTFLGTLEHDNSIPEYQNNPRTSRNFSLTDANELESYIVHNQSVINQSHVTNDDLATALLKLEEGNAALKLLKEQLKFERKTACDQLEHDKIQHTNDLKAQKCKYQNVIKRHQKFIEQLIDEKKQLSDKCNTLAEKIKELELKQQRELKVAIDRHAVELQRAKELCQTSEKIRRERWLEVKTSKIKEMTIKGLEPELRNMVDQHQKEIQDIRSSHIKELQDVELRAIRRSNQQLDELRLELTASHDKILTNEKEALRLRYQKKFDEQETLIELQQRKFFDELQRERVKFADEQARRDTDHDMSVQQISSQYKKKVENVARQFEIDKKKLVETYEVERETWIKNYNRQQTAKYEMAETKIRDDSNRERDRQIELAISRLEKETRDLIANMQQISDNKLKCLKDKYEVDLTVSKENEKSTRDMLTTTQYKLELLENKFQTIEIKLAQCQVDLNDANILIDKISRERDHAKKLARQEIECEKRELEEKILLLNKEIMLINSNQESHMAQLYSRIKLIITQKDIVIKNVSKSASDIRSKCDHLEKLLDQQRKEYILKTL